MGDDGRWKMGEGGGGKNGAFQMLDLENSGFAT